MLMVSSEMSASHLLHTSSPSLFLSLSSFLSVAGLLVVAFTRTSHIAVIIMIISRSSSGVMILMIVDNPV